MQDVCNQSDVHYDNMFTCDPLPSIWCPSLFADSEQHTQDPCEYSTCEVTTNQQVQCSYTQEHMNSEQKRVVRNIVDFDDRMTDITAENVQSQN